MPPRVCFIAYFSENTDEGMKKTAHELSLRIANTCESIRIHTKGVVNPLVIARIRKFEPTILHYFHGPTTLSMVGLRVLRTVTGARTVISATHPRVPRWLERYGSVVQADLILAQSRQSETRLAPLARATSIVPSGVNLDLFRPATAVDRNKIRNDLGIAPGETVALHAGSIVQSRNLEWVADARKHFDHMIVLGSTSTPTDNQILRFLVNSGCRVEHKYLRDIERHFQAADVYIFPTDSREGSIDFPLTVLEALATGLPVLTYPAPSLVEAFTEADGLIFIRDSKNIGAAFERAKRELNPELQRKKVDAYSWDRVAESIVNAYDRLTGRNDR